MRDTVRPKVYAGDMPALGWAFLLCSRLSTTSLRGGRTFCSFIVEMDSRHEAAAILPNGVRDEILVAGPRAPFREISSDSFFRLFDFLV